MYIEVPSFQIYNIYTVFLLLFQKPGFQYINLLKMQKIIENEQPKLLKKIRLKISFI